MGTVIVGAGILGVASAWYLAERGHEVTVVERQAGPALETSFANGAQISVSFCEPWASTGAPLKVAKWLARDDAPLLFRPRLEPAQWVWGLQFLAECNSAAFARNVQQLVALGRYSHAALKALVAGTGIEYNRLERGILHFFSSAAGMQAGAAASALMQRYGVARQLLSPADVLAIEPALAAHRSQLHGGIYTPSDESGDAQVFTAQLAALAAARGVRFRYATSVVGIEHAGGRVQALRLSPSQARGPAVGGAAGWAGEAGEAGNGQPTAGAPSPGLAPAGADAPPERLPCDELVIAAGAFSAPLLKPLGVRLAIYPAKGYSATLKLRDPAKASVVSLLDDDRKVAISRLGDELRIAGTAEMAGMDTRLDTPTARARCQALVQRLDALMPGATEPASARFWTGLRPSTPSNLPYIGRAPRFANLWLNTGHGTLGWTHGAGSGLALAELMQGRRPELDFRFCGPA